MASATILHADLDAFYASVEQLLDPTLRGVPMVVGEGVVLAASYEARAFGVRSAMPTRTARRLCPMLQVVRGSFDRYLEFSDRVMEVFNRFTPDVEQISVDEAFLQVGGSEHLFGPAPGIAADIRRLVRDEIGLAVSIGVATTKHLAKVASQVAKPDGLVVVPAGGEVEFLRPLPVELIWGVGAVTAGKLRRGGIETVGDLADTSIDSLSSWLGPHAAHHLSALARNEDPRPVRRRARAKSVGSQSALGRGLTDVSEMDEVVLGIADRVGRRMRAKGRAGRTVTVRVRFPGPRSLTRSATLDAPIDGTSAIEKVAARLLRSAIDGESDPVTLIAVSVSGLVDGSAIQMELGLDDGDHERPGSKAADTGAAVDRQVDEIRRKFGNAAVTRAGLLDRRDRGVPDEFRKLAERD